MAIEHVVIIVKENHAFDNYFGKFPGANDQQLGQAENPPPVDPPHDHGTWAVIAGLDGHETNHWWKRTDDGSVPGFATVERAGSERIDSGTIISMPPKAIHSLHNDSDAVSVTLHIYGRNVDYTDRCKYDPERHTLAPYRFGGTTAASR